METVLGSLGKYFIAIGLAKLLVCFIHYCRSGRKAA